mmetsp:Transcript_6917/g.15909  ORF Transcript_6917/g.15909 Transcript_6917/m.15909 type:complete len:207 (-) Transcript_6917:28-648(-)
MDRSSKRILKKPAFTSALTWPYCLSSDKYLWHSTRSGYLSCAGSSTSYTSYQPAGREALVPTLGSCAYVEGFSICSVARTMLSRLAMENVAVASDIILSSSDAPPSSIINFSSSSSVWFADSVSGELHSRQISQPLSPFSSPSLSYRGTIANTGGSSWFLLRCLASSSRAAIAPTWTSICAWLICMALHWHWVTLHTSVHIQRARA